MHKLSWNKRKTRISVYLLVVFILLIIWAICQPLNASPDEVMRYDIVQYLVEHETLPDGRDPEIRHGMWGISYAFNPILAYMIMAIPAKFMSMFTSSLKVILIASRMVNVVFGTIMAYFVWRIGEMLFEEKERWLFVSLVTFLPGVMFVHSYINTDSMALLSSAWIVYAWVRSMREGWSWKICAHLALGISLCGLSYYNAYGFALCSILFFISTCLLCRKEKLDYCFLFSRGGVIAAIVLTLISWWFIRNAILYDGDFLGWNISTEYAERYALEELKPSNRATPQAKGMSILDMMLYQPGEWEHNWIVMVAVSFIGTFGFMNIFMPFALSKIYILFFVVGFFGVIPNWKKIFNLRGTVREISRKKLGEEKIIIKKYIKPYLWDVKAIFHLCMLVAMVIPFLLLLRYSYASDFQAQGRYILPMVIPFMYFVTYGYKAILNQWVKNEKVRNSVYMGMTVFSVAGSLYTLFVVFLPNYI